MIYRNSYLANEINWTVDQTVHAADTVRSFLRSECDLLRLARLATSTVEDIERFLQSSAKLPIVVRRSDGGNVLVSAEQAGDALLITGKTAEVLRSYIDGQPVGTDDRDDMTLHRTMVN